jgi:hypothetical protein
MLFRRKSLNFLKPDKSTDVGMTLKSGVPYFTSQHSSQPLPYHFSLAWVSINEYVDLYMKL